jgi:uncharacterized protein YqgC (DUF456 family)
VSELGSPPAPAALVARVKAIVLNPQSEWPRIEAERSSIADVYKSHVLPLAAIGPVALLIGSLVFGYSLLGITYRPGVGEAIATAITSYVMSLIGVYLLALVIDLLAPSFGAVPDRTRAFKLAAYGATASWVVGIFSIVPMLGILGILGLYSLYLLYLGLPVMMKSPADKAGGYLAVVIVSALVLFLLLGFVATQVSRLVAGPIPLATGTTSGSLSLPGGGSLDLGDLEAKAKKMERAAADIQSGKGAQAIPVDTLKGLLPESLPGGLNRTSVESAAAGAGGIGGSQAEARYGSSENAVTLSLTDLGAIGGIAALGSALNIEESKETANSYEKIGKVDGRMTSEKFDSERKSGSYGVLVGDRVMVEAKGNGASIETFKAAVAAVDLSRIESLAAQ